MLAAYSTRHRHQHGHQHGHRSASGLYLCRCTIPVTFQLTGTGYIITSGHAASTKDKYRARNKAICISARSEPPLKVCYQTIDTKWTHIHIHTYTQKSKIEACRTHTHTCTCTHTPTHRYGRGWRGANAGTYVDNQRKCKSNFSPSHKKTSKVI